MKMTLAIMATALLTLASIHTAAAQVRVEHEAPLVNQYIENHHAEQRETWWETLEHQLILAVDVPTAEVDPADLQNIVFFASNHGDRLNLSRAVPRLREISRTHEEASIRILAVAALARIGNRPAVRALWETYTAEETERVRRITGAALRSFYGGQPQHLSLDDRD